MKRLINKIFKKAKPLTKWESVITDFMEGRIKINKMDNYTIDINYNDNKYLIWIANQGLKGYGRMYQCNNTSVPDKLRKQFYIRSAVQKKLEQFVEKNYDLSVDFIKANKLEQFFQE